MRSTGRKVRRRLRHGQNWLRGLRAPILVYQMGKVGSSSLYASLQALDLALPLHHCHLLNNLDEIERSVVAARSNPGPTLAAIAKNRRLRQEVLNGRWPRWNLVSLVRAPVQRNVSAFFENLTELLPDVYQRPGVTVDELTQTFVERYDHSAPRDWFDSQVRDVFGIDVFAAPFPVEAGYQIYEAAGARLLVMRLEDLDECVGPAMQAFVGLRNFRLVPKNAGSQKPYSDLYRAFINQAVLPSDYLRAMHGTAYARHFYRREELERFELQWSAQRLAPPASNHASP